MTERVAEVYLRRPMTPPHPPATRPRSPPLLPSSLHQFPPSFLFFSSCPRVERILGSLTSRRRSRGSCEVLASPPLSSIKCTITGKQSVEPERHVTGPNYHTVGIAGQQLDVATRGWQLKAALLLVLRFSVADAGDAWLDCGRATQGHEHNGEAPAPPSMPPAPGRTETWEMKG
jgi:hypothetical protein